MNTRTLTTLTALAVLIAPVATSAVVRSQDEMMLRPVEAPLQLDATRWREAMAVPDLDDRQELFGQLVDRARRDADLRADLAQAARGDDVLAWTSRLVLRELEWRRGPGSPDWNRRHEFFLGPSPRPDASPWNRLDGSDLFRRLEERLDGLFQEAPRQIDPGTHGRSRGFLMESGPDGVRVEVREELDGDDSVKTYEGESLEELLEAHPDLRERIDTRPLGGRAMSPLPPDEMGGIDELLRGLRGWPGDASRPLDPAEVPTDKLGILMRPPGQWSSSFEGVESGTGLYVERVFPGTLARALGILPGDILLRLNGEPLRGADDVKAVLENRRPSDPIRVVRIDGRGETDELVWRPRS